MKKVLAIDPGLDGAFVFMNEKGSFTFHEMPTVELGTKKKKKREFVFEEIQAIIEDYPGAHIFLERAVSFGMGVTSAFNYGRGFTMLEIAVKLAGNPITYVEPAKWTKVMHSGVDANMKPKVKSLIAVERLYPKVFKALPRNRNGKPYDGPLDAVLIAGYGLKVM